ncbi:hypothetical protein [Enhygromyxa salina]|uniref:Outer membrane protein beta-barrel domain-containing protein n=1 Tax=Enhygromyxa salina TaxID=215803 RepID=A0A2S9YU54_9BACT|nr:hypothetical protein [Enhygromyxa salina]PRQ08614.1 hypothetical protein ENSA7_16960 [Enhygromyxa salina]
MRRVNTFHRLCPIVVPALVAALYMGVHQSEAEAAPPPGAGFNDGGGYVTITPGALVLTGQNDFTEVNPSYGWGLGGGYMFAPGALFKGTIGVGFEHNVLMLDGYRFNEFGAHALRVMPELRLGLGGNTIWAYGLVGAGFAATMWSWDTDIGFIDRPRGRDSASGLAVQAGVGMQGFVYRNFFLGAEVDFDAGFFYEKDNDTWGNNDDDTFSLYQVGIEFTLGWKF